MHLYINDEYLFFYQFGSFGATPHASYFYFKFKTIFKGTQFGIRFKMLLLHILTGFEKLKTLKNNRLLPILFIHVFLNYFFCFSTYWLETYGNFYFICPILWLEKCIIICKILLLPQKIWSLSTQITVLE